MGRRERGILYDLAFLPWWVGVSVAAVCFIVLKFVLPTITSDHPLTVGLVKALSDKAWISGIFLIPAVISAFNATRKRKQLDRQSGIGSIRQLSWRHFEELVAEAYRRRGYRVVENTTAGADGGIDLRLERNGSRLLVQCKQWRSAKVGVPVVREMYGVMMHEGAEGVAIVTSGIFTQEAMDFASDKPIDLIEGRRLTEMISGIGASPEPRIPAMDMPRARSCPRCGKALVLREAKRGSNVGRQFWGCSGYPACRHIEDCG
jgi:restriction system protein